MSLHVLSHFSLVYAFLFILGVHSQLPLPVPPFLPNSSLTLSGNTNAHWAELVGNLIIFYEEQRSGQISNSRVPWRNSSCVDDGKDVGLDLSGGYYDAGDYIKSTFPLSATIMSICWGAIDFGKGYDLAGQTPYLDDMLRWSLEWLMKAHPSDHTLYVQVGDADLDNTYWGGDLTIPTPRPSYQINDTAPGTDVAAGTSAAFSACAALYANRGFNGSFTNPASLQNATYAQTLLTHAQKLYSFAVNATGGQKTYQNSVPAVAQSYPSSSYEDELTLAALFLAWAENSTDLYQESINYYNQFHLQGQNSVFNWDSKTPALPILFAQIAQSNSGLGGNFSSWQAEAERYFDDIVYKNQSGFLTQGGLLFYNGDSDEASLNPALNAAMLLSRYAPLASSNDKRQTYLNFAQSQLDYALGKNPMSVPYIVGLNSNSPSNPHSALATANFGNISDIDTSPANETYVLYGAVVGGPDKWDRFYDIRSDWPETEPALDYNAPMLTLAAIHVMSDTDDPFYVALKPGAYDAVKPQGLPCDAAFPCTGPRLSKGGAIAMGLVFAFVGVLIVGLSIWYLWLSYTTGKTIAVQ